jgi:hypothetical protein
MKLEMISKRPVFETQHDNGYSAVERIVRVPHTKKHHGCRTTS